MQEKTVTISSKFCSRIPCIHNVLVSICRGPNSWRISRQCLGGGREERCDNIPSRNFTLMWKLLLHCVFIARQGNKIFVTCSWKLVLVSRTWDASLRLLYWELLVGQAASPFECSSACLSPSSLHDNCRHDISCTMDIRRKVVNLRQSEKSSFWFSRLGKRFIWRPALKLKTNYHRLRLL